MSSPLSRSFPRTPQWERRGEHWWIELDGRRVRLSNLDKVFWREEGITKGDLLAYYLNLAPTLLPHVAGRPLTLKRMPEGIEGGFFFQKNAPDHTPDWMPRCAIEPEDGDIDEMLVVNQAAHLAFVVNLGCIELHPLHSRCEGYDRPDYLVFDLDPFAPAGFPEALAVARHVQVALEVLQLEGFPKTSGATGVQVYVPIDRGHSYQETRELAERIGRMILRADPGLVTMEWSLPRRRGRVFIEHNMNRRGASLASAYSVRPEPGAPVSAPLRWEEVREARVRPADFTISTIFFRLEEVGDLFARVATLRQSLPATLQQLGIETAVGDPSEGRLRKAVGRWG